MTGRYLVAFDFDHTLIDLNSDLHICKLSPGGKLPQFIEDTYSPEGWTVFMQTIFTYLHKNGIEQRDYEKVLSECLLLDGVLDLLESLRREDNFDLIIISDANSVFIEYLLKLYKIDHHFSAVYTNPASFDPSGQLVLQPYHNQTWCGLSTENLCKGSILDDHVTSQLDKGVKYDGVIYVGDGTNDLCPTLRINERGFCFARADYKLEKQALQAVDNYNSSIENSTNTPKWPKTVEEAKMKAKVHIWKDFKDILQVINKDILLKKSE